MNELMICFGSDYLYFDTKEMTAREAVADFVDVCERIRINIDNVNFTSAVLRDKDGNDIDRVDWGK